MCFLSGFFSAFALRKERFGQEIPEQKKPGKDRSGKKNLERKDLERKDLERTSSKGVI